MSLGCVQHRRSYWISGRVRLAAGAAGSTGRGGRLNTKRLVSALLAFLMVLAMCAGCGEEEQAQQDGTQPVTVEEDEVVPTIFADITGIPQDKIVMTVGEMEVPAELYFYWLCYVCSSLEYNILNDYSNYGMYSACIDKETMSVDWTATYAGMPLMGYAKSQAESTIKYYMASEELAEEKGAGLTTANLVDMENNFQSAVEEMGGKSEFLSYLEMLGISKSNFDRISATSYLYANLLDLVFTEGSDLYLPDEDYDKYATYADHILIASQNMQTGENLTPEETMEKYKLAESILEQLRASDDPVTLFAQLADEYSEDPGREDNPTGFIYTSGTMVPEFESAAALLAPGEISEIVQSDYGFHIILRRDLMAALEEDESRKVQIAREYLDQLLVEKRSASAVVYDECLDSVDWDTFYATYIAEVDQIAEGMGEGEDAAP